MWSWYSGACLQTTFAAWKFGWLNWTETSNSGMRNLCPTGQVWFSVGSNFPQKPVSAKPPYLVQVKTWLQRNNGEPENSIPIVPWQVLLVFVAFWIWHQMSLGPLIPVKSSICSANPAGISSSRKFFIETLDYSFWKWGLYSVPISLSVSPVSRVLPLQTGLRPSHQKERK